MCKHNSFYFRLYQIAAVRTKATLKKKNCFLSKEWPKNGQLGAGRGGGGVSFHSFLDLYIHDVDKKKIEITKIKFGLYSSWAVDIKQLFI